jgi:hypothetical protein
MFLSILLCLAATAATLLHCVDAPEWMRVVRPRAALISDHQPLPITS